MSQFSKIKWNFEDGSFYFSRAKNEGPGSGDEKKKNSHQLRRGEPITNECWPRECVLKVLLDLERSDSLYVCVEDEGVEKLRRGFHPHDAVDLLLRLLQDRDAAQRNLCQD